MASTSSAFVILSLLALAHTSNANTFLKKDTSLRSQRKVLSEATIEQRFLEEVRGTTGKGKVDLQIPVIKAALEPMWASLPKNQYGGLDNAQVRYALHRLFVQRHGWHIDGLTDISDQSSPAGVLKERVPAFLMELFEEAFGQTGLKLNELAVFAGTLERLIHDENVDRLKNIYTALEIETDANMSMDEADKSMKAFMLSLILRKDIKDASSVEKGFAFLDRQYPAWGETQRWLKDVRQAATPEVGASGYNLALMENATEQISMQLGGFLDTECRRMKDALLEVEEQSSGRVLLSKFYQKGLEKGMHFVETPEYLRQLGALDESQPGEPRVIVPNFIVSQNNCLVDTGSYSVCCLNECENVMAHLERALGVPEATPDQIVSAISAITTATVSSPQVPSQAMRVRLELVAERNNGKVPLYGRLFAQWLHFAFPRECPFPQISGSTNPLTPEDYSKATSAKSNMKVSELHEYISSAATTESSSPAQDEPLDAEWLKSWSDDEEVFFMPTEAPLSFTGAVLKGMLMLGGCAGVVFAAADAAKRFGGIDSVLGKAEKAHLV